jgi:3-hydroxybutyryl-CoA dehydrogenase
MEWLRATMRAWEADGRVEAGTTDRALARVSVSETLGTAVADADFILENVPEKLALKRELFTSIALQRTESAIIVSNTSSLPGSLMADSSQRADRFINANFSHLGHVKVEVMPNPSTSQETRERVVALLREMGFVPIVLAREQFGYAGNRVWRAVKKEVLRQLADGVVSAADVDRSWMLDFDTPIGPCGIMDAIGLDVVCDIEKSYADASGDPNDLPPAFLTEMVAHGTLGVKSGRGFYEYPNPAFQRADFLDGKGS